MTNIKKGYWKYGKDKILQDKFSVKEMEDIIEYEKEKSKFWVFIITFWGMVILMTILFYFSMSYKFGFICSCDEIQLFNMSAHEVLQSVNIK